jgi:CDP-paratose 2-epimerase
MTRINPRATPTRGPSGTRLQLRDRLGVCQWFHYEDHAQVERTVETLHQLGIRHLRTGISWADFYRRGGKKWYDWQMHALRDFEVLLSVWHTPPSISEGNSCNSPPRRLQEFADFIDMIITEYQGQFTYLELWNEPNNRYKWDFEEHDPKWRKFSEMIGMAAHWAQRRGQKTVLGGMIPVDHHWLNLMEHYGVLKYIDVVAIHAFPGMWWSGQSNWDWQSHWNGWQDKIDYIVEHAAGQPVWVTETGLATWDLATQRVAKLDLQTQMLERAAAAPAGRVYWYCLYDLDPAREAIEGFHIDENEYHLGLLTHDGRPKPAMERLNLLLRQKSASPSPATPVDEPAKSTRSRH